MNDNRDNKSSLDTRVHHASTRSFVLPRTPLQPTVPHPRDIIHWYPMYVSYRRELSVKKALDAKEIENYIPMREVVERQRKKIVTRLEPAIHNLIFINSTMNIISSLKMYNAECTPLQYMISRARNDDQPSTVITVEDAKMRQFIKAMEIEDVGNRRQFVPYDQLLFGKEGRRIRFVRGTFEGIEGTIKRINNNRSLLIILKEIGALVITIDHASDIEFLD